MNSKGGAIHFEITASNDDLKRKLAESRQAIINSGKTAEAEGAKIEGSFKRIAAGAGIAFTAQQALGFAKQIATVRGEFQQLEVAFTTMLGSKSKADALMAQMVETAAKTPFDLQSVAGGAKQLLAYGSASEKVNEELIMLGNVAAGLSIPLGDMVYLYGTTQTQGRLYTQDMRQFMGRGIPLADELAKQLGKTKEEITAMVTAGKIGFPEVQKALQSMTGDGGKFHNLMEEQSKTITGQISNLGDAIDVMFNKIGQSQEGVISGVIGGATSLVENYEKVGREIGALVVAYGAYKASIIAVAAVQNSIEAVKRTEEAAELLKLLTVEQQAKISKIELGKTSVGYATAVKAEVKANIEAAASSLAKARTEVSATGQVVAAKQAEYIAAQELVKQRFSELVSIDATGTAKQVEAAQAKLATAETARETVALQLQSVTRDLTTKELAVESAAKTMNTTATAVNTASQTANVTVTNTLAVAKLKLSIIAAKLNKIIANNIYVIAAVAVAVLAYGIYKLVTAQSQAEKAQEKFNKKLEEGKKKQEEFASKTNELVGVISTETNTRYMQSKAFKELVEMYPDLLKNMSMEELLLMDNMEVQKLLNAERERLDRKSNNDNLAVAQQNLDKAKKELDEYQNSFLGKAMILTPGPLAAIGLIRRSGLTQEIADYQADVDGFEKLLNEDKEALANARPVNVKIADLSENITLLQAQLKEIGDLQAAYAAANPYGYNPYDGQIEILNGQLSAKNAEKASLEKAQAAQKVQQNKAAADALKKLNQDILDDQLSLESERNAILEDGRKKRLAQSDLEHREKKAALKKEYDETVAEYKKLGKAVPKEVTTTYNNRVVEANNAKTVRDTGINEDADKELKEHQKAITDVFLNEESKRLAAIKERYDKEREWADAQFKGGNMTAEQRDNYKSGVDKSQQYEELESLLKEYQTYADKRKEIEEKFNSEVATLQSKNEGGKYDAQIKQAEKNKKQALSSVNFEEAKEGIDFTQLFGNLDNLTLPSQKELRNKIKAWIDTAGKDLSPEDLKAVSDAFNKLDLNIADKDPFSVLKSSISDYKTAVKEVDEAQKVYNETLEKYKKDSDEAKKAAEALTAANNKKTASVEKANEAIHSVADKGQQSVGAATDVMNIMGDLGIKVPEEIAGAIGGVGQMMDGLASIDLTNPLSIVTGGIKMIGGLVKSITSVFNGDNKKEKEIQKSQKQINALGESYDELGDAIEDAYSTDAANLIEQSNELLEQQNEQIKRQKELEQSKKKPDTAAIEAYDDALDENNKKIENNKEKALDAIFGEDIKSAIDNFANAYVDAWAKGEDRSKSAKDVVRQMMRQMVTESIKASIESSEAMKKIRDKLNEFWADGVLEEWEQNRIYSMSGDLQKELDRDYGWADSLMKDEDPEQDREQDREATKRGIATASQESVDENNGRLTAIQGHTFAISEKVNLIHPDILSIRESMISIRDNAAQQLLALHGIQNNTAPISEIRTEMRHIRDDINSIVLHGIKMK